MYVEFSPVFFDLSIGNSGIAVKPGGPIRFVNLPPIISARFSKGNEFYANAANFH